MFIVIASDLDREELEKISYELKVISTQTISIQNKRLSIESTHTDL